MKSIEIITLRAPGDIGRRALAELEKSIGTITEKGFESLKILTRAELDTDIGIHISWSGPEPPQVSAVGTRFAQYFRQFGLVNHSLWIESDQRKMGARFKNQLNIEKRNNLKNRKK